MLGYFDLLISSPVLVITPKALPVVDELCNTELQPNPRFVETGSFHVAIASLELPILQSLPPFQKVGL